METPVIGHRLGTTLHIDDRDFNALRFETEVDGDRTVGDQSEKVFTNYFANLGDVSGITVLDNAHEWVRQLRADGRVPVLGGQPGLKRPILSC